MLWCVDSSVAYWQGIWKTRVVILPKTNSSPLKINGWNTTFLLGRPIFRGYVSFREGRNSIPPQFCVLMHFVGIPNNSKHTDTLEDSGRLRHSSTDTLEDH